MSTLPLFPGHLTMITKNRPMKKCRELGATGHEASAVTDWRLQHAEVIEINWRSNGLAAWATEQQAARQEVSRRTREI